MLAVFRRDGLTGPVTRAVSLNQACPATPFVATYEGVTVECAKFGEDYSRGVVTPIRGDAPATPAVPADAVTASGSGLDPHISPAYATLQAPGSPRSAASSVATVQRADRRAHHRPVPRASSASPAVNVLELNLALDEQYPPAAS